MATSTCFDRPSEESDYPWLYAVHAETWGGGGAHPRSGKWLIFPANDDHLDALWLEIAAAVESGALGISAKASTAAQPSRVICVYTYDADDVEDVRRVLQGLRAVGIEGRLSYKEDSMTRANMYGEGVCIYTSPAGIDMVHPLEWRGRVTL